LLLMSPDKINLLIVTYADLKRCLYTSFDELLQVSIPAYLNAQLPSS
jgi:hypothetical protein